MMVGEVNWAGAGGTNQCWNRIYLNTVTAIATVAHDFTSAVELFDQVSTIYYLSVGDYVDLAVWHNTGSDRNVTTARFMLGRIG